MVKHGVNAIRTGTAERVPTELKQYTLEIKMESHPMWISVQTMTEKAKRLKDEIFRMDFGTYKWFHRHNGC